MPEQTQLGAGSLVAEKYQVRRLIGVGGMGAVYEVEHTFTRRTGALKLLNPDFAGVPQIVERFIREASAAGRIGDPHIIETYDAGIAPSGEPYIFMEMLNGSSVEDYVVEHGPMQFALAIELTRQACRGLAKAHEAGIVHRDIKPENLFLVAGPKPLVKVIDFGISKFDPSTTGAGQLTVDGTAMGTPFFMPPEQVVGERDLDGRADIYSLAVSLYRMVTGAHPFEADSLPAISVLIHEGKYERVSVLRPDTPPGFDEVVDKGMAKAKEHRYSSMEEFDAALGALAQAIGALGPMHSVGSNAAGPHVQASPAVSIGPPLSEQSRRQMGNAATTVPVANTMPEVPTKKTSLPVVLAGAGVGLALLVGGAVWFASGSSDTSAEEPSASPAAATPEETLPPPNKPEPQVAPSIPPEPEQPPPATSADKEEEKPAPQPTAAKPTTRRKPTSRKPPNKQPSTSSNLRKGRLGSEFTAEFE